MNNIHWSYYLLFLALLISVYTDITKHKIYNWLTFPTLALGLGFSFLNGVGIFSSFIGFLLAFAVAFLIYITKGIYGGDVKLMAAIGAWLGQKLIFSNILYIFAFGGIIGVFYAIMDGKFKDTIGKVYRFFLGWLVPGMKPQAELEQTINRYVPYGIAISLGTVMALLYPL